VNAGDAIIDMQASNNVLFASTSNKLYCYDFKLDNSDVLSKLFVKEIPDCSNIKIDYTNHLLFAFSSTKGIIAFNIRNPRKAKFISSLRPVELKREGNLNLTEIDVYDKTIFLVIRKSKIIRIDLQEQSDEFGITKQLVIGREFDKISLQDPQDAKYYHPKNLLYVADADLGFMVINIQTNEILFTKIFEDGSDFPQKIILLNGNAVVKTCNGLYFFNFKRRSFDRIFDYKIGSIAKYYNSFIYSKNNKLNYVRVGRMKIEEERIMNDSSIQFERVTEYIPL